MGIRGPKQRTYVGTIPAAPKKQSKIKSFILNAYVVNTVTASTFFILGSIFSEDVDKLISIIKGVF